MPHRTEFSITGIFQRIVRKGHQLTQMPFQRCPQGLPRLQGSPIVATGGFLKNLIHYTKFE